MNDRTVNRLSGLAMALLGIMLIVAIIPDQTERVDGGWIQPQTLPNTVAWLLVGLGLVHTAWPSGNIDLDPGALARVGFYIALAGLAVYLMQWLGFLVVMPALTLLIMVFIGERRPFWLLAGGGVIPLAVWGIVTQLLGRSLP